MLVLDAAKSPPAGVGSCKQVDATVIIYQMPICCCCFRDTAAVESVKNTRRSCSAERGETEIALHTYPRTINTENATIIRSRRK